MTTADTIKTKLISWLIAGNLAFNKNKDSIALEVLFSRNRRQADLLVLSNTFHAIEIKGDRDNLKKLITQLKDYHRTFELVSVVTTLRHLTEVRRLIKPQTGLILLGEDGFTVIRSARKCKLLNKASLLMFLNKQVLKRISNSPNADEYSTDELRRLVSARLKITDIRKVAYNILRNRHQRLFKLFINDIGTTITLDDLVGLSGKISDLSV